MPKKQFKSTLNLDPEPDPIARKVRGYAGKRSGLGICLWLWNAFDLNERLPRTRKLTNAALERELCREFSHKPGFVESVKDPSHATSLSLYRHKFNQGKLLRYSPPRVLSVRYNQQGIAVDSRTGRKPLTKQDYDALCAKYGLTDEQKNKTLYEQLED